MTWRCPECGDIFTNAEVLAGAEHVEEPVEVVHATCDETRMEWVP